MSITHPDVTGSAASVDAPSAQEAHPAVVTGDWLVTHDFLYQSGGAERVTLALADRVLGGAPVRYLSGSSDVLSESPLPAGSGPYFNAFNARTFRAATPLYPGLIGRMDPFEGNVLASSYAFAHHVPCTGTKVVYCHSPLRQIWSMTDVYLRDSSRLQRAGTKATLSYLRKKDLQAMRSAHAYVASGPVVQERLERFYGLHDVRIVRPPVDTGRFHLGAEERGEAFLWVGRVNEPYKRLEMVIEAMRRRPDLKLTVAGDGPDRERLEAAAPGNVTFLGWRSGEELVPLYQQARALIFPSEDDFGIVPLEAMACGAPCIAFRGGGATDTITEGATGLFFDQQTPESLLAGLREFERSTWSHEDIAASCAKHDTVHFVEAMRDVITSAA